MKKKILMTDMVVSTDNVCQVVQEHDVRIPMLEETVKANKKAIDKIDHKLSLILTIGMTMVALVAPEQIWKLISLFAGM